MVSIEKSRIFANVNETQTRVFQQRESGNSSVGRAQPCQGWGREFESRFPLKRIPEDNSGFFCTKHERE